MNCEICSGTLELAEQRDDYYECVDCKTQFLIANGESLTAEHYANKYLQDDVADARMLNANKMHYINLWNSVRDNTAFMDIIQDIDDNINACHCYGGGFPQFETTLPIKSIDVYDLIAPQYKKKLKLFNSIFDSTGKTITYNIHNLLDGVIEPTERVILTFSHILEHLPVKDINKTLQCVNDIVTDGSYVVIYQPNMAAVKGSTWIHYNLEHLTLMSETTLVKHIESFNNLKVVFHKPFSDDLFIIAKVCK